MYEMEQASDYPGYDGPSTSNGFLEADDDLDRFEDAGEEFAWFELDADPMDLTFEDWLA